MYVYYGTAWVDASPVDGAGISSTNQLVNGAHTVSLGTDGSLTLPANSTNPSIGVIRAANGFPTLLAYGSAEHGGPELDWMDADNPAANFYSNTVLRNTMYINRLGLSIGMNENEVAGTFSGLWSFGNDGKLTLPGNAKITNPADTVVSTGLRLAITGSVYDPNTGGIELQLADPAIGALISANPSFYSFRFASGAALGVTLPGLFVAVGTPAPNSTWRSQGWGLDTPNISSNFDLFSLFISE
jgi:hypothetical protein